MKTLKRVLASLLTAVMLLTVIPFAGIDFGSVLIAKASDLGIDEWISFDNGFCYYLEGDTGCLTIRGKGAMYDDDNTSWDEKSPFSNNTEINYVIIQDGATSISSYLFYACTNIEGVVIPDSVTSIDYGAFDGCTDLTSITIPDSVTSIGSSAFYGCTGLTSITIPDSVTSIGDYAFAGCTGLTSITIPDGVISMGGHVFAGCTGLKSVTIPDSIISIGYGAFSGCTGLTSIMIPDSVKSIGEFSFYGCTGLTSIAIPSSVEEIFSGAFQNCRNLTKVNINSLESWCSIKFKCIYESPGGGSSYNETNPLEYAHNLFLNNKLVTDLVIPDSISSISDYTFMGCRSLTSVTIPNTVTSIGSSAFYGCTGLTSITIPDSATNIGDRSFDGCTALTRLTIPASVTNIGDYAFYGCTSLTSITIPDSVTSIGFGAFYGCKEITDVYYTGTEEQWNSIDIGSSNLKLTDAYIHFNWVCEHNYKVVSYIAEPDCTHEGSAKYMCKICGKTKTDIAPVNIDHHILKHMTTPATCTGSGYEYDICTSCYQMFNYNVIPAKGHSWGEWVIDTPATCTTEGARHHICTACGDAREDEVIPAHGHSYKHMVNSATCEKDGTEYDICTECMDTKNIVILPKTGHDWSDWVFEPDATCTVDGLKYRICKNNNSEREEVVIKAEGHSYKDEVIAPTCEERGYTTHTCEKCGDIRIDTYVDAIGHDYKWRTSVNPTATSEGLMIKECTHCGLVADEMTMPKLVPDYVTGLTLSSEKEAINIGETVTLTATVNPDTAKNKKIIWKSSEKDVATVSDGTVTALKPGVTVITAQTEDGGYKEYCLVRVIGIVPAADTQTIIDSENGLIYGLSVNATNIEDYIDVVDDKMTIECASASIGTGTQINIISEGQVIDTYETVIFGDANGDGWYDGTDAMKVKLIAGGMLTEENVGEAVYTASDCNHDGVIDSLDVDVLEQAGVLLANVDQSKSSEELLATSSDYVKYLNLIEQTVFDESSFHEPIVEPSNDEPSNVKTNIYVWIIDFIVKIFDYIKQYLTMSR